MVKARDEIVSRRWFVVAIATLSYIIYATVTEKIELDWIVKAQIIGYALLAFWKYDSWQLAKIKRKRLEAEREAQIITSRFFNDPAFMVAFIRVLDRRRRQREYEERFKSRKGFPYE